MEYLAVMWEERDASWLQGLFENMDQVKAYLASETNNRASRLQQNIAELRKESEGAGGLDLAHYQYMINIVQQDINIGMQESDPKKWGGMYALPDNVITGFTICGEYFTVSKWVVGKGRKIF